VAVSERRRLADCTCGAEYAGGLHKDGCPRYRSRAKSGEVIDALRRRFSSDGGEWLCWEEWSRIDLFAIYCWSEHRFQRVACEVKTSRSDFLAEIRKSSKRQDALDLSHLFYFCAPKGLIQPHEIPDEAGLIEVQPNGRTKVVVKAPVRQARPLRMSEVISLARRPLYRGGILQLRGEVRAAEGAAKHSLGGWERERQAHWRAQDALARHAGHLVAEGSLWKGRWEPQSYGPGEDGVVMYVEEVELRDDAGSRSEYVTLRRLDGKDTWPWRFYGHGRAEVLERFEPLDTPPLFV
jgi:hypothetical protein